MSTDEYDEDDERFQIQDETVESRSQSSEGDTDSLNTGTSSREQANASSFNLRVRWKHESVVLELLNYYTEQVSGHTKLLIQCSNNFSFACKGDIQMCVTLYLVLEKYLHIDNERIEDWFTAYIELLHRFKLWTTATAIIKACKVQNVRERNEVKKNAANVNYELLWLR